MDKKENTSQTPHILKHGLAPWLQELELNIETLESGRASLIMPFNPKIAHPNGHICTQVYMALADTAMNLAALGEFSTTHSLAPAALNTSFVRPLNKHDVRVQAQVLRRGKTLVFGDVKLRDIHGELIAHTTCTYSVLG